MSIPNPPPRATLDVGYAPSNVTPNCNKRAWNGALVLPTARLSELFAIPRQCPAEGTMTKRARTPPSAANDMRASGAQKRAHQWPTTGPFIRTQRTTSTTRKSEQPDHNLALEPTSAHSTDRNRKRQDLRHQQGSTAIYESINTKRSTDDTRPTTTTTTNPDGAATAKPMSSTEHGKANENAANFLPPTQQEARCAAALLGPANAGHFVAPPDRHAPVRAHRADLQEASDQTRPARHPTDAKKAKHQPTKRHNDPHKPLERFRSANNFDRVSKLRFAFGNISQPANAGFRFAFHSILSFRGRGKP